MIAKLSLLMAVFGTISTAVGAVSTRVCIADGSTPLKLADPNVPFVYRDIMVGTKLTIIVSSDCGGFWAGGLFMINPYGEYAVLSGRDYNAATSDWQGSHLPAAGRGACVYRWDGADVIGFELGGHETAQAGDWFIVDYNAITAGSCKVGLYDYDVSFNQPVYDLTFFHVPTRDFDTSTKVDFADFAIFASQWQAEDCFDPNRCEASDLDADGRIDAYDLILFADYWLERTE
jgi:hypothetical protein